MPIANEILTRCPAGIAFSFPVFRRREVDIASVGIVVAQKVDMYLLAVPDDVPDNRPEG